MARIVAVVTSDGGKVAGGVPVFIEKDPAGMEQTAFLLEKIMDANAHDLKNGSIVIVNHKLAPP
ncbi:capping complex subunit for YIEGIA [Paenibacillus beijingensis]|uniref:Uncharacterized protein n=1 Tax=Paenibacillus beijingensis TaxID=1126833 RepID=A0A0D5NPG6_9BACL|nr:hypothetical protein [Paenibacillus beijingensis]AJY77189.1 hypothetical protein VN24_24835 [Paenibacillus beijingensis]